MATERPIGELVKLAAAGNDAAVTELYERTSNHAYYLALQLVKDEDEAQDILEDAYIKALMNIGSLQDPSKFQGWLNSIVVNASKDYLKKKKPVLFSQLNSGNEDDEAVDFADESEQFSPEATVDYNETKRLVKEMIDNLPEEQRIAIILHYMEDYSVKDIAQMMECSEGTVKSRLNYGRKQIEKDVLDLEKKGTKLYCAPLVPFLFWMFHTPAPASVISTAASTTMAAGAAADSTVGATVTAGTAAGSTVDATVTTGTAAGSTVGATVSADTAASTVGATVAAETAETTASTVGATVTAGTASGSTVGATVTTGAAASAAGATVTTGAAASSAAAGTATATGLSLAAKIGIVAAIVCIGGGAAIGATAMSRNSAQNEAVVAESDVNDEGKEHDSPIMELVEELIDEEEPIPEITAEEQAALKRLYDAMESEDFMTVSNVFLSGFTTIYAIERKYLSDQNIIFDGEKLSRELEGYKLVIKTNSWDSGDIARFSMTIYLGDFVNGVPDGKVISYVGVYPYNETTIFADYELSVLNYVNGVPDGFGETWSGIFHEGEFSLESYAQGNYAEQGPVGEFEVLLFDDFNLEPAGSFSGNSYVWDFYPDSIITFHVDSQEIIEFVEEDEMDDYIADIEHLDYYTLDDTGRYYLPKFTLKYMITVDAYWYSTTSRHRDDTDNLLPDGSTLEEYVQTQSEQDSAVDETTEEAVVEISAVVETEAEESQAENTEGLETYLYIESGDASVPLDQQAYFIESDGNMTFLLDENGDIYTTGQKPEWGNYAKVRVTGELEPFGTFRLQSLTPITVWDEDYNEVPYGSIQAQTIQTQPETTPTDESNYSGFDTSLWLGRFVASDNQVVTVERVDSDNVYVSFYGYGEEGWYTSEQVWALYPEDNSTAVYRNYNNSGDLLSSDYITLYHNGESMHIESQSFRLGDYYKQ